MLRKEKLREYYDLFILSKRCEMVKERTVLDYKNHFRYFGEYLEERGVEVNITVLDFKYFPLWMKEDRSYRSNTINIRLSTLKCFLKWLCEEGHVEKDISSSIKKVKEDKLKVKSLSLAQQEKFMRVCRVSDSDSDVAKRSKYFLMLIYYTGMRPQEMVNLKVEDLNFREEYIRVNGDSSKTYQTRIISTWDSNLEYLLKDIIRFNSSFDFTSPYLFFNLNDGSIVNYATIRHNISKYKKDWGLRNLCAYALRHTFAVNTQKIGPGNLQQVMGHKSFRSTERYFNSSPEMVKKSFKDSENSITRLGYLKEAPKVENISFTGKIDFSTAHTSSFGCKVIEKAGWTFIKIA